MINYSEPCIDANDISKVTESLLSPILTQGCNLDELEKRITLTTQSPNSCIVSNATAALYLTCKALGFNSNTLAWVPAITFVSTANAARFCGSKVEFVDVDPATANICCAALESQLISAQARGGLPDYLFIVHMAGTPCDLDELFQLCLQYNIKIIEDASHALGAYYFERPIGSFAQIEATIFSFHPVKMITTGEGGAVVSHRSDLINQIKNLRNHGINRSGQKYSWEYDQTELGFNCRLPELNCALGLSQLEKLSGFVETRNLLSTIYDQIFDGGKILGQKVNVNAVSSRHLYIVRSPLIKTLDQKQILVNALLSVGIRTQVHYIPLYRHSYYQTTRQYACVGAEEYYKSCLTLPLHVNLSEDQIHFVADHVKQAAEKL